LAGRVISRPCSTRSANRNDRSRHALRTLSAAFDRRSGVRYKSLLLYPPTFGPPPAACIRCAYLITRIQLMNLYLNTATREAFNQALPTLQRGFHRWRAPTTQVELSALPPSSQKGRAGFQIIDNVKNGRATKAALRCAELTPTKQDGLAWAQLPDASSTLCPPVAQRSRQPQLAMPCKAFSSSLPDNCFHKQACRQLLALHESPYIAERVTHCANTCLLGIAVDSATGQSKPSLCHHYSRGEIISKGRLFSMSAAREGGKNATLVTHRVGASSRLHHAS